MLMPSFYVRPTSAFL